jgi:uncharacterized glyoxalase superfamily protein PhnB
MPRAVATVLMFEGAAEEAMTFYASLFRGSEITRIERYGPGEDGPEGAVKRSDVILSGQHLICFDSLMHQKPSHTMCPQELHSAWQKLMQKHAAISSKRARVSRKFADPFLPTNVKGYGTYGMAESHASRVHLHAVNIYLR